MNPNKVKHSEMSSANTNAYLLDMYSIHAGPENDTSDDLVTRVFITFIDCGDNAEKIFTNFKYTDESKYPRIKISELF
jgi:hypothetical protein